jgi:hypothetical protein
MKLSREEEYEYGMIGICNGKLEFKYWKIS